MEYRIDDQALSAERFLPFVNQVWPGNYDVEKTEQALKKTVNITAYDGGTLVGCLRPPTDGCFSAPLQSFSSFPNIRGRGSEAVFLGLQRSIPRPCCISGRSQG